MSAIEIWEDPESKVRFYFTHSDSNFTTGVMMIPPGAALPKHNRPLAVENLIQISGKCLMKLFGEKDQEVEKILEPNSYLQIPKAQFHIHSNPYKETSYTLFKADGDITVIMKNLHDTFEKIELNK